jgi:transcription antitermination factor NusG
MPSLIQQLPWYAVHIRMYGHEHVERALQHKGFDVFAPKYARTRLVGTSRKSVLNPLFPGYLFCALDQRDRLGVLTVPGVINILGMGSSPSPVPDHEIDAIRRAIDSGLPFEPIRLLEPGELVEVQSGPLAGVTGVVLNYKGKYRLVITVTTLNDRAVSVEVDSETVTRCKSASLTKPAPHKMIQEAPLLMKPPALATQRWEKRF